MELSEMLEEKKYLAMELQAELDDVTNDNIGLRREIIDLDSQIRRLKGDIASTTIESLQINCETVQFDELTREQLAIFNEEHQNILLDKIDTVKPLKMKFEELRIQRERLEEEILALSFENEEYKTEIIDIQDRIDFLRAELPKKSQIIEEKERISAECRIRIAELEKIIKKSNIAIGELQKRSESLSDKDGGFQTRRREINLLKKTIQEHEEAINKAKDQIIQLTSAEKAILVQTGMKSEEISNLINWAQEKRDFLQEIEEIKNEIQNIKSSVESSEKSTSSVYSHLTKCAPFIKKWKSLLPSIDTPSESIQELLSQLSDLQNAAKCRISSQTSELEGLIASNNKLEEDLNRKKAKVSKFVDLIRSDEIRFAEIAKKEKAEAKQNQEKLLRMIGNAKLDVIRCI